MIYRSETLQPPTEMPTTASKKPSAKSLWWLAIGLFLLHRALLTWAAMNRANQLHKPWTLRQLFAHNLRHWDAGWYINIAGHGYHKLASTAFFPFYPILLRLTHSISGLSYPFAGTLISSLFFIISMVLLGKLVSERLGFSAALASMSLLALYPISFFFDSMYTESVFLALTLLAVYLSAKGHFWAAGAFALLATLTRNTGVFIDIILFFDYLASYHMGMVFWTAAWWKKLRLDIMSLLLAPLGLVAYMAWLQWQTGNPLAFLAAERLWHRHFMPPWGTWYHTLQSLLRPHPISFNYNLLEFSTFTIVIVLLGVGVAHARRSLSQFGWWLYAVAVTVIASSEPAMNIPDYLLSFPRFVLMLFPVFMYLGFLLRSKWLLVPVLVGLGYLFYLYGGAFTQGTWIS